jgi:hypothetical protein
MVSALLSPSLISALLAPVVALLIAWAIGHRLAARWSLWQKRREQTLTTTGEFYRLYGEFFSVWKLWETAVKQRSTSGALDERAWNLLDRAVAAEANMETMMVRLASERVLRDPDLATLGRFRQGFQSLRETIREQKELGWSSSEHKKYRGFKELAISVSRLVSTVDVSPIPTADHAQESLRIITSNLWEGYWEVHREGRHPPRVHKS